jgi:hypothetical protein
MSSHREPSVAFRVAQPLALLAVALALAGCRTGHAGGREYSHAHAPEMHGHDGDVPQRPPPLGLDLCRAWCAPVEHAHVSRRGTPYVHSFHVEPAFLGRDLLVHVEREGDEHEVEAELEWALTRRLLLVAEVPYVWADGEDGVGDAGLGLRGLLVETDRFLFSAQLGFEFPTARDGFGADEVVVAPGLLAWADLGRCFSAQAGMTLACGTESGDTEFSWGASLAKSFPLCPLLPACRGPDHGDDHDHAHATFLTFFVEGRGVHPLSGPDQGASTYEVLFGVSVPVATEFDLRAGWTLLWDDAVAADSGWVAGFVLHL